MVVTEDIKSCCAGFYELPVVNLLLGDTLHPGGAALTKTLGQAAVIGRDTTVLDVACGRGESARLLAGHFGCRVTGIDYSHHNVGRARALTQESGLTHKICFSHGDAEQLPFPDEVFDVVMSECSLCTFPKLEIALTEMRRVLRPGGRIAISDVVLNLPVPATLDDLFGHVLCVAGARSASGYKDALNVAGFTAVRSRDVSHVLSDMIQDIERRVSTLDEFLIPEQIEVADGLTASLSTLGEAREFVLAGGVGYALITAKKKHYRRGNKQ